MACRESDGGNGCNGFVRLLHFPQKMKITIYKIMTCLPII